MRTLQQMRGAVIQSYSSSHRGGSFESPEIWFSPKIYSLKKKLIFEVPMKLLAAGVASFAGKKNSNLTVFTFWLSSVIA